MVTIPTDLTQRHVEVDTRTSLAAVAAGCAVLAGVVHLVTAPGQLDGSWLMGGVFVVVGAAQLALAVALGRALGVATLLGAVFANCTVVGVYVVSRTVGLPWVELRGTSHGHHPFPVAGAAGSGVPVFPASHVEAVAVPDVISLLAELVLIAMLVAMLPQRIRPATTSVVMSLGLLAVVARAVGLLG